MEVHNYSSYCWIWVSLLHVLMWNFESMDSRSFSSLCASICFATLCFAMCCLHCARFDVQGGDRDVKEVHAKTTRVQDCAVEALRLRKKRVKI